MGTKRPADLDRALGVRIREVRIRCGMSQETLAKAVGLTFQQVQKYESGINRVSFARLVQIADAFNTTVPDLIKPLAPMKIVSAKKLALTREPYLQGRLGA